MKFYDRKEELKELKRIQTLAFTQYSRMTVITGRRRIGKTSLATEAVRGDFTTLYLFVGRKSEGSLCEEFIPLINKALGLTIPVEIKNFRILFQMIMEHGRHNAFNLIIDEFQEFDYVNKAIFGEVQNIWDRYRKETNVNLLIMGSVYSMMHKIFEDYKEPLFGRADNIIKLSGFGTETMKEIMADFRPNYSNDELLALYSITGGVPKYIELLCENTDLTISGVYEYIVRENSPFTEEGKNILIEEFGKDYGIYFSILSCIASGTNMQSEIEAKLGVESVGGQISRLIDDYSLIQRKRPLGAKRGTKSVIFEIQDNFFKFWFRYFDRYQSIVAIKNFTLLREIMERDYATFSGTMLERYFRLRMEESHRFRDIGSWWQRKKGKEANEIDLIGIFAEEKKAFVAEVKRQRRNYDHKEFMAKIEFLKATVLPQYEIIPRLLTLEDM